MGFQDTFIKYKVFVFSRRFVRVWLQIWQKRLIKAKKIFFGGGAKNSTWVSRNAKFDPEVESVEKMLKFSRTEVIDRKLLYTVIEVKNFHFSDEPA
jgi:hypothetical protein